MRCERSVRGPCAAGGPEGAQCNSTCSASTPAVDVPEGTPARIERRAGEFRFGADVPEVPAETAVAKAGADVSVAGDEPALEPLVVVNG